MIHGALKALRTHVHHLSTLRPGPWSSRAERSPLKQREELYRCCSLIYKTPILWMLGASARCSCLHTPVETVTPPRRQTKPAPFRFPGFRKSRESCTSAVSVFLSNSDPLRWALSWGTIEDVSDEACSVPLPRFPQEPGKLHIRSLRLPFQLRPASLGSELGNDRGRIRRSLLRSASPVSARAGKAAHPQSPSSFPTQTRFAGL